ncbi:MAG: FoF1 ATP synthase subunit a [Propionivibrio sp.]
MGFLEKELNMSTTGHEAAASAPNAGEYVLHHLANLNSSGHPQNTMVNFSIINYDTLFFSIALGAAGLFAMWLAARKATSGVPGRGQAALEILIEMVGNQAKAIVHNERSRRFVAPLALTVFIWVFLMNAMDFLPVRPAAATLAEGLRRSARLPARGADGGPQRHARPVDRRAAAVHLL